MQKKKRKNYWKIDSLKNKLVKNISLKKVNYEFMVVKEQLVRTLNHLQLSILLKRLFYKMMEW